VYKLRFHKSLSSRWYRFSRSRQILSIANELHRARNFMAKGDRIETINAFERTFELLDLTVSLNITQLERYELLRFREMLGHLYLNESDNIELTDKLFRVLISLNKDSFNALQ
jgi:hypothetical protein